MPTDLRQYGFPEDEPPGWARLWGLDLTVAMLNHGSFGACPLAVLQRQAELRRQMEAEPVRFFLREMPPLLDACRERLAGWLGAAAEDVVPVGNATAGINGVLRSLDFRPGDEILVTDHGYNAATNVARYVAQRCGARVVVAELPLPIESPRDVVDGVLARVTLRTRIALLDHVTSPTAVVFPIEQLVAELGRQGIDTLVDGAHAPGMVPLALNRLGAAYYTGNLHKWVCAPKGAAFLHVRKDRQAAIQPPILSHGFNRPRPGHTRFQDAFDWPGTGDPTAWLCLATALDFLAGLLGGGIDALMCRNHRLAVAARRLLCQRLHLRGVCPEAMLGSMAAVCLPDTPQAAGETSDLHPLGRELLDRFGIEVPVMCWPAPPRVLLRISAQAYNDPGQYEKLADALATLLGEIMTTDNTFDRWAEVYEAMIDWPKRLSREEPFYRRVLEQLGAKSVLDAACGTGQHAAMLHGWGLEVEGADLSPSMIERARATFGQSDRLRFVVRGFAEKVELPGAFDAVLCVGNSLALARIPRTSGGKDTFETAEIRRRQRQTSVLCAPAADAAAVAGAMREMLAAVRPGGVLILHLLNLWRLANGPCLWQNCRRAILPQGEVLILKGVHRCQRRGYVDVIVMNPDGGPPLATDSVAFLGLEAVELEALARQAGASTVHAYGNYQDAPYDRATSVDLVMVIEK